MLKLLNQFCNDARGATAIEYAVIGAFLSILIVAGTRRAKRRGVVDKLAAQVILQGYLDATTAGAEDDAP